MGVFQYFIIIMYIFFIFLLNNFLKLKEPFVIKKITASLHEIFSFLIRF